MGSSRWVARTAMVFKAVSKLWTCPIGYGLRCRQCDWLDIPLVSLTCMDHCMPSPDTALMVRCLQVLSDMRLVPLPRCGLRLLACAQRGLVLPRQRYLAALMLLVD